MHACYNHRTPMPLMIEFFAVISIFVTTMVYVSIRGGAAAQRQQAPTRRDLGE